METNEEQIKQLKAIAEAIIIHYMKNNFPHKARLKGELERIHNIIAELKINIENYISGSPIRGGNSEDGITLYVKDKNNISIEESNSFIAIIIHEIYHSISKLESKNKYIFLEEGFVSEITAETIRYVMNNPIDIGEVKKDELEMLLRSQEMENGYEKPSEFVRSTQVIMKHFGYNAMFEYMFSESPIDRISELANKISPEFGKMIKRQSMKNVNSINYASEKEFFLDMFRKIDFNDISETDIEMNKLLQYYLVDEEIIDEDSKLYDIVCKYNIEILRYKEFYKENSKLEPKELHFKIKEELDKVKFEYQTQDDRNKDVEKIIQIINKGYESSLIKPLMFWPQSFFGKIIAYDMYQRGIKNPTDKDVQEYANCFVCGSSNAEKNFLNMVFSEWDYVYNESENGMKISEIMNQSIANHGLFEMLADKVFENITGENFWKKIQDIADMVVEQKEKNSEILYVSFYHAVLEMTKKYVSMEKNKIYNENDYQEFKNKMDDIFNKAGVPVEFMTEIGWTSEKIFLKAISEKTNFENRTEQTLSLLEITKNDMNLGNLTNDLQDFALNIFMVYEDLKSGNDKEKLEQYIEILLEVYYKTLKNSTTVEIRKSTFSYELENKHIIKVLEDACLNPGIYSEPNKAKELFTKYPDFYRKVKYNNEFLKMLINDLPENKQQELKDKHNIYSDDIKRVVLGKSYPNKKDIKLNKLKQIGEIAKFFIVYDEYNDLLKNENSRIAERFWEKFYGKTKEDTKNMTRVGLCNKIREIIPAWFGDVNEDSIKKTTKQIKDEMDKRDRVVEGEIYK